MGKLDKSFIVVSCGRKKASLPRGRSLIEAKEAYASSLFLLCREYAEKFADTWVILSGKYGIVKPSDLVDPRYDKVLKLTDRLIEKISKQLTPFLVAKYSVLVSLCGAEYTRVLRSAVSGSNVRLTTPLEGLRIGERQKFIRASINNGIPLT